MRRLIFLLAIVILTGESARLQSAEAQGVKVDTSFTFAVPELPDSVWMELYVPPGVPQVRGVIAFIDRGLDRYLYDDRDWRAMCARAQCALLRLGLPREDALPPAEQPVRNAALGGGAALLRALVIGAERASRPDLRDASLLVFGFSAAGNFAVTFAAAHPERTIGFIQYHSNLRGLAVDTLALAKVPGLLITGALDERAGSEDSRSFWLALRSRQAPWAFVNHRGQPHFSVDGAIEAGPLMREWARGLLSSRLAPASPGNLVPLRASDGWVVHDSTWATMPASDMSRKLSSWVPNADVAQELRLLSGICSLVPREAVDQALGAPASVAAQELETCRYTAGSPARELWLVLYRGTSALEAREVVDVGIRTTPGSLAGGVGDLSYFTAEPGRKCSTLTAALSTRVFYLTLCGEGFGTAADSTHLQPLMRRFLGQR
jgi:hypothetical protein